MLTHFLQSYIGWIYPSRYCSARVFIVEGEVIPMKFEKISIREILALVMLGIVNIMAVLYGWPELAMSISSGLVGYLGGRDMRHDRNQ